MGRASNHVLFLIKGLGRGGAEQLIASSVRHLDRARFEYEVAYLLPWKNALVPELEDAGIPVHCLKGARGTGWLSRLRSLARDRRIDLVHVHSPYAAIGARLAFPRKGPRMVYTEHNVWARYHRATYWGNVLTFPRNDYVFAVSDQVRRSIRYPSGLRSRRVPPLETRYYGVDAAAMAGPWPADGVRTEFGIGDGAPIVGTVANFKVAKGHPYLLQAAARVRREVPDVRFVLVGQGPLEDEMRRQARALSLDGSVIFAGFREDVPRLMRAFDVLAVPSLHDGLSISLLEAMALGTPPVVTRAGGNPEVVEDGRHGLVVEPADPGALADAIVSLLRDRSLRDRLGEAARRRAGDFDIRAAVHRVEEVYQELLA
jgi:glycosyltransferase involved in cell wall biosynthesis